MEPVQAPCFNQKLFLMAMIFLFLQFCFVAQISYEMKRLCFFLGGGAFPFEMHILPVEDLLMFSLKGECGIKIK